MIMKQTVLTPGQLGQVLKGHRKTRKLTQKAAGAAVGLLPKTISKLELAPETATIESLFKLLSTLQLELSIQPRPETLAHTEW